MKWRKSFGKVFIFWLLQETQTDLFVWTVCRSFRTQRRVDIRPRLLKTNRVLCLPVRYRGQVLFFPWRNREINWESEKIRERGTHGLQAGKICFCDVQIKYRKTWDSMGNTGDCLVLQPEPQLNGPSHRSEISTWLLISHSTAISFFWSFVVPVLSQVLVFIQ